MTAAIEKLRAACLQRGVHGIKMIGRTFRAMDDNGSKSLDRNELTTGLQEYGVPMSRGEIDELFNYLDKDKSGSISFDEFLIALRPPMSKARLDMVDKAFAKMDVTGDGQVTIDDLRKLYDVTHHPKYKSGEWTADQVLHEFLTSFQAGHTGDVVTKEDWLNYYSGVSSSIDDDDYFVFMMQQAWKF